METLVQVVTVALAVVTLVIAVAFRRPGIVAVSLLPNLVPIGLVLGAMGWADVPLNTATVTVAGIALGFGAFVLSPVPPTLFFGLLISLAAVAAVACDLIVLPALLLARAEGRA